MTIPNEPNALDRLLIDNPEYLEALPIKERALIPGALPDELSISDIATLAYPDDTHKQDGFIGVLEKLCVNGQLPHYGDIKGWSHEENEINPYPKVKSSESRGSGIIHLWGPVLYNSYNCLLNKDALKDWFQAVNQWPVNGLLGNWWQAEPVTGTGTTGNKKVKGETDKLRTAHFIEWVEKTEYKGGKTHYVLQDALRADNPKLWGKNEGTFKAWLKTNEAKPAKDLLNKLKLDARLAV